MEYNTVRLISYISGKTKLTLIASCVFSVIPKNFVVVVFFYLIDDDDPSNWVCI
jgi:hypothetical protein